MVIRPDQKKKLVYGFRAPYFRKCKFLFLKKILSMDFARLIFSRIENFFLLLQSPLIPTNQPAVCSQETIVRMRGKKKNLSLAPLFHGQNP